MRNHLDLYDVPTYKHRGITYYGASITILRIRYRKTFSYSKEGYEKAIEWKKEQIKKLIQ